LRVSTAPEYINQLRPPLCIPRGDGSVLVGDATRRKSPPGGGVCINRGVTVADNIVAAQTPFNFFSELLQDVFYSAPDSEKSDAGLKERRSE